MEGRPLCTGQKTCTEVITMEGRSLCTGQKMWTEVMTTEGRLLCTGQKTWTKVITMEGRPLCTGHKMWGKESIHHWRSSFSCSNCNNSNPIFCMTLQLTNMHSTIWLKKVEQFGGLYSRQRQKHTIIPAYLPPPVMRVTEKNPRKCFLLQFRYFFCSTLFCEQHQIRTPW